MDGHSDSLPNPKYGLFVSSAYSKKTNERSVSKVAVKTFQCLLPRGAHSMPRPSYRLRAASSSK